MIDVPVTDFKIRGENLQKEEEGRRTLMDDDLPIHPPQYTERFLNRFLNPNFLLHSPHFPAPLEHDELKVKEHHYHIMGEDKKFIVVKKSITSFLDDKFGSKLQRVGSFVTFARSTPPHPLLIGPNTYSTHRNTEFDAYKVITDNLDIWMGIQFSPYYHVINAPDKLAEYEKKVRMAHFASLLYFTPPSPPLFLHTPHSPFPRREGGWRLRGSLNIGKSSVTWELPSTSASNVYSNTAPTP